MKRINVTIEDETYLKMLKKGMMERQEVSKTVSKFLKLYVEDNNLDNKIADLQEEIKNLKLKNMLEITKETEELMRLAKEKEEDKIRKRQIAESIKNNRMLEDAI